jgi:hypothetical protein
MTGVMTLFTQLLKRIRNHIVSYKNIMCMEANERIHNPQSVIKQNGQKRENLTALKVVLIQSFILVERYNDWRYDSVHTTIKTNPESYCIQPPISYKAEWTKERKLNSPQRYVGYNESQLRPNCRVIFPRCRNRSLQAWTRVSGRSCVNGRQSLSQNPPAPAWKPPQGQHRAQYPP